MPLTATPVPLAPHGTYWRAAVCIDTCIPCRPLRMEVRARDKAYRDRLTQSSRESKRKAAR